MCCDYDVRVNVNVPIFFRHKNKVHLSATCYMWDSEHALKPSLRTAFQAYFYCFFFSSLVSRLVRLLWCAVVVRMWMAKMAKGSFGSRIPYSTFDLAFLIKVLTVRSRSHCVCTQHAVMYIYSQMRSARKQCERVVPLFGFHTHRTAYGMKRAQRRRRRSQRKMLKMNVTDGWRVFWEQAIAHQRNET